MKRGYFTDFLGNLVRLGFGKDKLEPEEYFLLGEHNDLDGKDYQVELPDDRIKDIEKVGFIFNEL